MGPTSMGSLDTVHPPESDGKRYVLITPVRDEEAFIGDMIDSVLAQTILPAKWIIVDDGSTDRTPQIVESYASSLIQLVRLPAKAERQPGGEGAIAIALRWIAPADYDFIGRFDADLVFESDYMENILGEFARDARLGIAGGGLYDRRNGELELEKEPEYHVRGALKMYRSRCFQDIGGLTTDIGWDTIDEVMAWTSGWKTRSFVDYRVIHRRPTGRGIDLKRVYRERGRAEYLTWSTPVFVFAKTMNIAVRHASPVLASAFARGYLACHWRRETRLRHQAFTVTRRRQQWSRMLRSLGLPGRQIRPESTVERVF